MSMSLTRSSKNRNNKTPSPERPQQRTGNTPSIIGPGVDITGDVETQADIHTDGQHEGNIRCSTLTVGEAARIEGNITADVVEIAGHIHGNVVARLVDVRKTGLIVGGVAYQEIRIDLGGQVNGSVTHGEESAKPQGQSTASARPAPALHPVDAGHAEGKPQPSNVKNLSNTA